ncbi:MAG: hypothetical protein K9I94_08790 [Bacteroidales bacterium]|nr:hypothetical protein [Bacteroidales bacterium]
MNSRFSLPVTSALVIIILAIAISFSSCRKDEVINTNPSVKLEFSTDTVFFDTVFTTIGTVTKQLHVYNPSDEKVRVSNISIARGTTSPFSINVDGEPASSVNDIEIPGNDSIFVFVRATIDPTNKNSPLIETDSIMFETNGNLQDVDLVAWGQDAYFYRNAILGSDYVLSNDKPHVIYGFFADTTGYNLTVEAGARVHFHKNAFLYISKGTLKVNGTINDSVVFSGDRLDMAYRNVPGQWRGIILTVGSKENEINYANIRNADVAIQVDTLGDSGQPTLTLNNTVIENARGIGLLAQGSYVQATNSVFRNCGYYAISLSIGGEYDFRHCTVSNFWGYNARQTPSVLLNNYYEDTAGTIHTRALEKAYFGNCTVIGSHDEEILLDKSEQGGVFNYTFENCLLQTQQNLSDDPYINSFKPEESYSALPMDTVLPVARNAGSMEVINSAPVNPKYIIEQDIRGNSRINDEGPDVGAYEFVGEEGGE